MEITVEPELERFLEEQVEDGRYACKDDVIRMALRLLKDRERRLEELRCEMREGLESGAPLDGDQVFDELLATYEGANTTATEIVKVARGRSIMSARHVWDDFFDGPRASDDFMSDRAQPAAQEREDL